MLIGKRTEEQSSVIEVCDKSSILNLMSLPQKDSWFITSIELHSNSKTNFI